MSEREKRIMVRVKDMARAEGLLSESDGETITATTAWMIRALRQAEVEEPGEG